MLLFFLTPTISLSSTCNHSDTQFSCVKYLRNFDADTITFEIPNVHPLLGQSIAIRLWGIDTAELYSKSECERAIAIAAKSLVKDILLGAKRVDLTRIERGKYFRIVADVVVDGQSLSDVLLEKNMGYPYFGGKKRVIDWCEWPLAAGEQG